MGDNIRVEIEIDFGSAKNNGIHYRGKVALPVIVVRSEGRCRYMPRIAGDRAHSVEIKGLAVEDIVGESFFEQFNEEFGRTPADKAGSYSGFFHQLLQIADKGESNSAGACTPMSSVMMAPQSPPCATNFVWPRRFISTVQARAMWAGPHPVVAGFPEYP